MFPSIKHRKSLSRLLACSLVIAGLAQNAIRPSAAAHQTTPTQPTLNAKESNESAVLEVGAVDETTKARINAAYNKLPLRFEENRGQVDTQVKFISRGSGSTLFLMPTEAVLTLHRGEKKEKASAEKASSSRRPALPSQPQASSLSVVRMKLHGANRSPHMSGESVMSARTNYFIGNDPQQWHGDVAQYERVRYAEVYPGIDMLYYGQQQSLEYDFEVAPGADPRRIVLGFKGVRRLKIEAASGDLLLETAGGEIRQSKPVVYQEVDGERREVEGRYVMKGKRKVGFKVGAYDTTKALVIDPVLKYSTYLGGNNFETGIGIAVDSAGNAYVTGYTVSTNFPTLNQYQGYPTGQSFNNVFVTKLNTNLSGTASLLYSTYLGGSDSDTGISVAVDASGNAYVAGYTLSTDFPVLNQYQSNQGSFSDYDAFLTRLNTNLSGTASLIYSTYLGGNDWDFGYDIAVDSAGNAYVTGQTDSTDFPTLNQYQSDQGQQDAFVTKLNTNLSGTASLLYSTYLGGNGFFEPSLGIAIDAAGNAYVTGYTASTDFPILNQYQSDQGGPSDYDAFVTRLNTNLSGTASLIYSTYLGGNDFESGNSIAVDSAGNAYVTGGTSSSNFPVLNQYQTDQSGGDAFVTRLNTNLSGTASLIYSTYLGGNDYESGSSIAVDASGNAYVTGGTISTDFPVINEYQTDQGLDDAFVTKLNTNLSGTGSLIYSTYLGGNFEDSGISVAVDSSGNAYVVGKTSSSNFPIFNQYQANQLNDDVFVTKLGVASTRGDFDADRKTDLALWHPTSGNWEIIRSSNNSTLIQQWGMGSFGDKPVPGDFDGDGKTDIAVWRPSNGTWYILQSSNNVFRGSQWGASVDKPVLADFDGDSKTDLAVYRPSTGTWYILQSSNNSFRAIQWGNSEDKPVPADYDGDQKADVAVWRPSTGTWYILQSSNDGVRIQQWGANGDKPVAGDYDGDGKTDIAIWRPTDGNWYALRSSNGGLYFSHWGESGDTPVPGDYDADGKTDTAVWRPTTGSWYILKSLDGMLIQQQFGSSGDIPVPSAYLPE